MEYVDILGYIAAFITNISMYPQAFDVMNNNNIHDINPVSFFVQSFGCGLWIWYGYEIESMPIFIGSSCSIIPNSYITVKSIIYRCNRIRPSSEASLSDEEFRLDSIE